METGGDREDQDINQDHTGDGDNVAGDKTVREGDRGLQSSPRH